MQVVGAIIRNHKKEYLLQLRDDKPSKFKNCWTLFGGRVEDGEDIQKALFRELNEEIGLTQDLIDRVQKIQINRNTDDTVQYIYEVYIRAELDRMTLYEGAAMKYVSEDQLFDRDFAFNIRQVLEDYVSAGWVA